MHGKPITWPEIEVVYPEVMLYLLRLKPVRSPHINPWHLYEQAKRDLAPRIPDVPGAYEAVIGEVCRRLKL